MMKRGMKHSAANEKEHSTSSLSELTINSLVTGLRVCILIDLSIFQNIIICIVKTNFDLCHILGGNGVGPWGC